MNLRIASDPGPYVSGRRFRELGALVVIRRGVERGHITGEDRSVGVRPRGWLASQTQRHVIAEDPPELWGASFVVAHHAAIVEKDGLDLVQVD